MESHSEQARRLAVTLDWEPFEAKCKFSKGIALYKLGDYVTAYEYFEEVDNVMEGYYISKKKMCYWLKCTAEALERWSSVSSAKPVERSAPPDTTLATGPGGNTNVHSAPEGNEKSATETSTQPFHSTREDNPVPIQLLRPQPRHDRDQFPLQYGKPVPTASPPLSGASPRISSNRNIVQPHTASSSSNQAGNIDAGRSPIADLALDESHVHDSHRRELAEAQNAEAADSRILSDDQREIAEAEEAVAAVLTSFHAQRERRMQEADPERNNARRGADGSTMEEEREADDGDSHSSWDSRFAESGVYELRARQREKEKAAEEARKLRKS
ncbi:MAG: hypothetical protein Q9228_007903, partial [Teloschistes exilis]